MDCQASPLTTLHVPGTLNAMADFASQSFEQYPIDQEFLTEFNKHFVLPQNACWNLCLLPSATIGHANASLLTMTSELALWRRHTQCATITGGTGATSFPPISIRTFKGWMTQQSSYSYKFLLNEFAKVIVDEDIKYKPVASRQPSGPSERPSNWLGLETPFTVMELPIIMHH